MPIDDLRLLPDGLMLDADLAIVGAGPAGLTVARELAGARLQVLVIESGGLEQSPEAESLNEIVSIGAPREMDQTLLRRRMLGGSSTAWAGRVTAFDSIDYQARAWVPHSGWPFTAEEMAPYLDRAAAAQDADRGVHLFARARLRDPRDPAARLRPEIDDRP